MTTIQLDVHHYIHNVPADTKLDEIVTRLIAIQLQGEKIMTVSDEIRAVISDLNTATNEVASDLERLRGQVVGGMSEADAADSQGATLEPEGSPDGARPGSGEPGPARRLTRPHRKGERSRRISGSGGKPP